MASNNHQRALLRRYKEAAYQIANEPETMEESDEEDSVHVGVGNVSRDESFSELEQAGNVIDDNMEIDRDEDDDHFTSSEDGTQEYDKGERY